MDDERSRGDKHRGRWTRAVWLGLGCVAVGAAAWYVHGRQMPRIDGAHLLYLPVVLACLWFGWYGLVAAVLGGACLIGPHFVGGVPETLLEHDILRTVVLILVGGAVSALRGRQAKAQREVQKLHQQLHQRRETSETEYEILSCRLNRQLHELREIGDVAQKGDAEKEKILDSLAEHVVYLDREMRILWANQAAARSVGLGREALVGRHCYEFWAQASEACLDCPVVEAMQMGQAAQTERTTPDGRRWFLQGHSISNDRGEVVAGVEVSLDVTECRTAQEQLQRIFDLSLDMVCVADINTCTFTRVNPAFERTLGYTEEELLARPFLDFVHPEDVDRTVVAVREKLARGDRLINFENRYRCKDGSYRWLNWMSHPKPEEGLTYAVARDITKTKATEETLTHERNLLRTVIDNLPDAIYVKDRHGRFLLCNEHVLRYHGVSQFEAIEGKTDFDLFPRELAETFYAEERALLDTGHPLVNKERCGRDRESGKPVWHSTTKLPLGNAEGQIVGLVGIGRDITDFRRAQEAYQTLVDQSLQGLVVMQDQRVVFANQAMVEISGYTVDEILAAPPEQLHAFIHPEDRDRVWHMHRARMEGQALAKNHAFRVIRKDGTVCWLEIFADRIEYKRRPAIQAACVDVTERVCAENALRASEAHNRALLHAIPDLIFRLSTDGVFLDFQSSERQALYLRPEEFLGKKATEILPNELGERLMYFLGQTVKTGQSQTFECQLPIGGEVCEQECRLVRCGDEQILAMVRDITERKRSERLARIAHELAVRLSAVGDLRKGARQCVEAAFEASTMDCGAVYLADETTGEMGCLLQAGVQSPFLQHVLCVGKTSATMRLISQGKPVYFGPEERRMPVGPAQKQEELCTYALLPILDARTLVGCLVIGSHRLDSVPLWSRPALETIAAQIGNTVARLRAEQSWRESEERFRQIFENTMLGLYRTTPDGRVLMANPALVRMLGFSSFDELAQRKVDDGYISKESRDLFKQRIEADGQVVGHEAMWTKRDGTPLFVCENAKAVHDASGEMLYYEGTVEDVTQRKEAEMRLCYRLDFEELVATISNDFVNLSVDEIDSGINRTLERLGRFVGVDRSFVALLGDSDRQFDAVHEWCAEGVASTRAFLEAVDVERFSEAFDRLVHTGLLNVPCVSDLQGPAANVRETIEAAEVKSTLCVPVAIGGRVHGLLGLAMVRHEKTWSDDEISLVKMVAEVFANALERRRSADALGERLAYETLLSDLSAVFVNLPVEKIDEEIQRGIGRIAESLEIDRGTVVQLSQDGTAVQVTHAWAAEGLKRASIGPLDAALTRGPRRILREAITVIPRIEVVPDLGDEEKAYFRREGIKSMVVIPLAAAGTTLGVVAFASVRKERHWPSDLVQRLRMAGEIFANALLRKRAEKAAELHRVELARAWNVNALGEMASGLAHELNQPLCAILNYANGCLRLTRRKELPKTALKETLQEVAGQAERAADIIKRIRGLVGKREPRCVKLDVKVLLTDAMRMIEKEAAQYDVTVVSEFKSRLPKIHADDVEIEQVALNLMRNAIEAMGDEKVGRRRLTVAASRPEKEIIEVAITDTGRGLPPELSDRVFNSFFTTKQHGLGIGLSLSRRIIEAHGGRLWAESDGNSGTTFRFTLPVVGAPHETRRARSIRRR